MCIRDSDRHAVRAEKPGEERGCERGGKDVDDVVAEEDRPDQAFAVLLQLQRHLCAGVALVGLRPELRQLLIDLVSTGKPVVFCSFGNPYVLADLPKASGALCAYDEDCPESVQAAVEVLLGEQKSAGRLPVRVSERYRFGHGL